VAPRIGAYFDQRNPPQWQRDGAELYSWTLDWAQEGEHRGLDAIWLTEHHMLADGYLPQALVMAAGIAARTRAIRVGTAVLIATLRSPIEIAEQAAVVDLISGGRLELGLGAGYAALEFALFDVDSSRRFELLEQRIVEIQALCREHGITPAPVQVPIPIWVGAGGARGARIAGRVGAGLLHLGGRLLEPYGAGLREGGHPPSLARTGGVIDLIVAEDPERAWAAIAPHVGYQQASYRHLARRDERLDAMLRDPRTGSRFSATPGRGVPAIEVTTPAGAVERVRSAIRGKPVTDVMFWATIAGMPKDIADRHLELLCDEVAPALREEDAQGSPADRVNGDGSPLTVQ